MRTLHQKLMHRNGWYALWHNLPDVHAANWAIFMLVALLLAVTVISKLN